MKNNSRIYGFKKMLMAAALFGCLLGISDIMAGATFSQIEPETQWYCPVSVIIVGDNTCRARGCKKSSTEPDSFWVCDYTGGTCPPLESCELGS